MSRRVVVTGLGLVSPLGNSPEKLWQALSTGQSGIGPLQFIPALPQTAQFGGEAREFTGAIEDFGPLEKVMGRNIKKSLKMMCREIQMGVAVAQLAITHSGLPLADVDRDRIGVLYGSDYMMTLPHDFADGIRSCLDERGEFDFTKWGDRFKSAIDPLWLLKYLPNLPAAHLAIFNDLHGPNNSLTVREASSNMAVSEAYQTISRGHADAMIAGATGTRIHVSRTVHTVTQEEVAEDNGNPAALSRPFDLHRTGQVIGEGAGAIMLEELEYAQARDAKILGEVIGFGSSSVTDGNGVGRLDQAVRNVLTQSLRTSGLTTVQVGHINAHGLGTHKSDAAEAQGIRDVFSASPDVPVVAAKSYFGNLGAGSGLVELIASVLSLQNGRLFRTLNYDSPDPQCPVNVVTSAETSSGDNFINLNITPQGQASAVVVAKHDV
ncbi:MAG: beta-ketoacyl-[acyl-carrier-protein] synthase family protein [Pirellulaceae bacterium]